MIKGIGLDLVELDRIEKMIGRSAKFAQRILTNRELAVFNTLSDYAKLSFWQVALLQRKPIQKRTAQELVKAVNSTK